MKKTLKQLISGLLIFSLRGNWYGFTLDLGEQGLVDPKQKEPRKKGPLVGWVIYRGLYITQLYRDYFINHEIRIPFFTNQDSMESGSFFFFRGSSSHH